MQHGSYTTNLNSTRGKKMSKLDEEINNTASDVLEDMRVSLCELQAVIDEIKQRVNYREDYDYE